ncbi:MAG: DNA mismatch repair endonuclease MutL, partial [Acidobacteriaceae bacterium]|nr:DNA mismatch repair endonuclease MutL [Acidobacteriaceae bacterium]
ADDLAAIRTLGFRGEALPSIASVSHFLLRTRARGQASGTEVRVNGGTVASVAESAAKEGTTIEVSDLFYNLPARRKFLKSDAAESAQISRVTTQLALAYPDVGFTLTSAGRTVLQCPPATSMRDRLFQLYGDREELIEVKRESAGLRIDGFIAALAEQGPVRGPQHVFINRRIVKDRTIAHAIIAAYSVASIKERSPEVHLFIEMPADAVDVNVHPTKAEVRFRDQSLVHEVVRRAVMDALGSGGVPQLQLRPELPVVGTPSDVSIPGMLSSGSYPNRWQPSTPHGILLPPLYSLPPFSRGSAVSEASPLSPPEHTSRSTPELRPMIPLGQFRDTFIIAIDDEGIAIIDQHVAHERVLFERVMERLTAGDLDSQRLLLPLMLDLPHGLAAVLESRSAELARLGYDVEPFGEQAIKVSAVPALMNAEESARALQALADDLDGLDRGAAVQVALQRIAATTACHAAVKANAPLNFEKMTHILDELRATAHSTICPHGRPVMLRLTRREIEKNFDRI